jgi:hypothetical protein
MPKVRYYHVELDRHAVLFSEGLPSESYLDTGNRAFFQNNGSVINLNVGLAAIDPSFTREAHSCAPFICAPDDVQPVWEGLAHRAIALGYALPVFETSQDPAPKLIVDGRAFRPVSVDGDRYCFMLPSNPAEVRLASRAARPCDTRPWVEDERMLGVSVSRVRVHQGRDVVDVALDGPALGQGWWQIEQDAHGMWRWTDGEAVLRLPEAQGSSRVLEITMGGGMTYLLAAADADQGLEAIARIA